MSDLLFIGITLIFFVFSAGFVELCNRLREG